MAVVLELDPTVTPRCLIPVSDLQTVRFDCVCRLYVFLLVESGFLSSAGVVIVSIFFKFFFFLLRFDGVIILELNPTVTSRCLIPVSALQAVRFDCVCRLSVFLLVECVFLVYCVIVLCSLPGLVFWAFIYIYWYFSECFCFFHNFGFLSLGILGFLELDPTVTPRCLIPVSALQKVRFDCV